MDSITQSCNVFGQASVWPEYKCANVYVQRNTRQMRNDKTNLQPHTRGSCSEYLRILLIIRHVGGWVLKTVMKTNREECCRKSVCEAAVNNSAITIAECGCECVCVCVLHASVCVYEIGYHREQERESESFGKTRHTLDVNVGVSAENLFRDGEFNFGILPSGTGFNI